MNPLPAKKRSELRAEAHKLTPVVIIGDKGLTDEVLAEIDRSLKAHELIKVRAATDERDARDLWLETICEKLQAHPVQQIGKVFVVFRANPKEEKPVERRAPRADAREPAKGARKAKLAPRTARAEPRAKAATAKRSGRPPPRTPSPRPESAPPRRRPRTSR
jgi:RNA-binding protein